MIDQVADKNWLLAYEELTRACGPNGAHVFAKVRVADTISLNGLDLSADEFTYGLEVSFRLCCNGQGLFPAVQCGV
jgi:hypothetical protein